MWYAKFQCMLLQMCKQHLSVYSKPLCFVISTVFRFIESYLVLPVDITWHRSTCSCTPSCTIQLNPCLWQVLWKKNCLLIKNLSNYYSFFDFAPSTLTIFFAPPLHCNNFFAPTPYTFHKIFCPTSLHIP